jgi:hypothetical protein
MREIIKAALEQSARKTFEDMCFMYPMPELADIQKVLPVEAAVQVKYRGSFTGTLVIRTAGGLLRALAANMLGDDAPSLQQQQDALGEVANMICGNVLPAISGGRDQYVIEGPTVIRELSRSPDRHGEPIAATVLYLDKGRADLMVYLDSYFPHKETTA